MTGKSPGLTGAQRQSASRIAGLTVVNAMVFQEVLAGQDARVQPLRKTLESADPISAFCEHWHFILDDINYVPIFKVAREVLLALASGPDVQNALRALATKALDIVGRRAALRHDLMGRVYHRLLTERIAKYLATYYTSVPAATLLLEVALQPAKWAVDWSDVETLSKEFSVADLACGTGTLLMATAEAMADNHVRACAEKGAKPDLARLHRCLVERVIHGYDVLPSALHLTASTLALKAPDTAFKHMELYSLPLGGPQHRLGSIDFLRDREVPIAADLFGPTAGVGRVSATGYAAEMTAKLPDLDLCVMNPPFTRSVGSNLLFGSLPDKERRVMQQELAKLLRRPKIRRELPEIRASSTAGLGSVFAAVGDRYVKEGGRIALVLPKALLSGVAWGQTRELFRLGYRLECLMVSHQPDRWNFSENTNLSEVLLVARKMAPVRRMNGESADVVCLNLRKNPETVFEALGVAHALASESPPDVELGQGALEVMVGGIKFGEAVSVSWSSLREGLWMAPCAFAESELVRAVHHLVRGRLYLPGSGATRSVRLCALGSLGKLGPDRRDIHDGFRRRKAATSYPAFWGHDASAVTTLSQATNAYLSPLPKAKKGRPLRKVEDLWPLAGRVVIAEGLRLNTQRLAAVRLGRKVLSNVWWPFRTHQDDDDTEKALVLWLNSTLGLLVLLAHREETEGPLVGFKKPVLEEMPVLDVLGVTKKQRQVLADAYDRLSGKTVLPFPEMDGDPVRREIDEAIRKTLRLPDFGILRELLAREPVVCLRPLEGTDR